MLALWVALAVMWSDPVQVRWDAQSELCGEPGSCSDAGECVGAGPIADICPEVNEDAVAFIAADRECSSDEDCNLFPAECYMGTEQACTVIALNFDADPAVWDQFNTMLGECVEACGGEACGATARCSDQGQCVASFP